MGSKLATYRISKDDDGHRRLAGSVKGDEPRQDLALGGLDRLL